MKTAVTQTSRQAFYETSQMRESLETKMFKGMLILSKYGWSANIRQLAESLQIDKSSASARLNWLKFDEHGNERLINHEGQIYHLVLDGKRKDPVTGRQSEYWKVEKYPVKIGKQGQMELI